MSTTNVYAIVTPFVIALIFFEFLYCLWKKNNYYSFQDSISSMGTAIINQCTNLAVSYLVLINYHWIYTNFRFTDIPNNTWTLIGLFFGVDFLFYWFHRFGHTFKILWAAHMPHHSTEELNYAVGLRASVTQRLSSFIFYWPLAFLGYSVEQIIPMVAFHLVLQLIPHTRVIPKLHPWIEYIFNTPSHHRVHHACNQIYRDKNFGGFLIIWDRLFGTFEEEIEDVYFGVTKPPRTWDPTYINFQTFIDIYKEAKAAPSWLDKIKVWFMPLSWRPKGLPEPEPYVELTAKTQKKFTSTPLVNSKFYLLMQSAVGLLVMYFVIFDNSPLSTLEKILTTALLWWMATSWAMILEGKNRVIKLEFLRTIIMFIFLYYLLHKYNYSQYWSYLLIVISLIGLILISRIQKGTTTECC